jgi:hypothetical protein
MIALTVLTAVIAIYGNRAIIVASFGKKRPARVSSPPCSSRDAESTALDPSTPQVVTFAKFDIIVASFGRFHRRPRRPSWVRFGPSHRALGVHPVDSPSGPAISLESWLRSVGIGRGERLSSLRLASGFVTVGLIARIRFVITLSNFDIYRDFVRQESIGVPASAGLLTERPRGKMPQA